MALIGCWLHSSMGCWGSPYLKQVCWFIGFLICGFWFMGCLVLKCLGFLVSWFLGLLLSWCLGFLVSWCLSFLVSIVLASKLLCFLVSKFLGLKVWKFQHLFNFSLGDIVPYYQISISCFQEYVGSVSEIFKNWLDESTGLFGPRLFQHFLLLLIFKVFDNYIKITCKARWNFFVFPKFPGVSKDRYKWFSGSGARSEITKS